MSIEFFQIHIPNLWLLLVTSFALALITSFLMQIESRKFFTVRIIRQRFSMLDFQFPASPPSLKRLITGINALGNEEGTRVKKALKNQVYIDFLFMPGCYATVFLVCMYTSYRMEFLGQYIFAILAWLQSVAWLCDIYENIYILDNLKNPGRLYNDNEGETFPENVAANKKYKTYQLIVKTKWIIASIGTIGSLFALLFFWMRGEFNPDNLYILLVIFIEIIGFIVASRFLSLKFKV